ncbi:MAG: (d)CMP kinase [Myxococcota bacterium]|nr:(d)CMP kinase [Myxococcota bacterium]
MPVRIAIDGPASSGKGTVARLTARRLGYAYVDTGAMYRAVALFAQRRGVSTSDSEALGVLTAGLSFGFAWNGSRLTVYVNEENISELIRDEAVGQGASQVSIHPPVRAALLEQQRDLASAGGVVMEGRDIGTVVLPDAELKIFLDASLDVRAARRTAEMTRRGLTASLPQIREEIRIRDVRDRTRPVAPLTQAPGAIYVDTSSMTAAEAAEHIAQLAEALA